MSDIDKRLFEPCDDCVVEELEIGREKQPLLKVDGCMKGAQNLRDCAAALNDFKPSSTYYPGLRMPVIEIYPLAIIKFYQSFIDRNFNLDFRRVKKVDSAYSIVTTPPKNLDFVQTVPHIDAPSIHSLAMIHYLSIAPGKGTAFYRQEETGFEYVDGQRYNDYKNVVDRQKRDSGDKKPSYLDASNHQYCQIAEFDALFNRLLMYRGSSLHSGIITPSYDFDPSPASGRLTITTFIEFFDSY